MCEMIKNWSYKKTAPSSFKLEDNLWQTKQNNQPKKKKKSLKLHKTNLYEHNKKKIQF